MLGQLSGRAELTGRDWDARHTFQVKNIFVVLDARSRS